MAVTAEYSSETWAEFFEPTFNEFPELRDQLVKEFITYKQTGSPSDLLGRDAPFDFPTFASDANVHHIHLNLRYERTWTEHQANFHRTSNHYLVYTEHMWDSGRYLLMGVVTPAHEKMPANNNQLLSYFAEVAERFHSS
ncbi:type II toxin-antitoxin system YafO family toxin [Klebsiella pneumoniae]|nr:type II toxin-antitoxin system YafO family toxin [Klebsiella pneumoniae]